MFPSFPATLPFSLRRRGTRFPFFRFSYPKSTNKARFMRERNFRHRSILRNGIYLRRIPYMLRAAGFGTNFPEAVCEARISITSSFRFFGTFPLQFAYCTPIREDCALLASHSAHVVPSRVRYELPGSSLRGKTTDYCQFSF